MSTTVTLTERKNTRITPDAGEADRRHHMKKSDQKWMELFRSRLSAWNRHRKSLAILRKERQLNELQYRQTSVDIYAMQYLKFRRID